MPPVYAPLQPSSVAAPSAVVAPAAAGAATVGAAVPPSSAIVGPSSAATPSAGLPATPSTAVGAAAPGVPAIGPPTGQGTGDSPALEASYSRVAHPAVAERLRLTDDQRKKVAELIAARAEALAKVAPADRVKLVQEYEQKLSEVLTEAQRAAWSRESTEPRLRFNFRFQRWIDVLEWFARQADLSLVLDAPPPGTFNYTDAREYTPTEAIDLLNGVLMTKGYTLIRHERMLIVVNLANGIPEGLVPRVRLEDLDKSGKFELVSMLFPLAGRNVNDVTTEIKPLLGPNGKVTPLPATGQLLVMDTAGVMRALHAVIQSIPPGGVGPVGTTEVPQLAVYAVKGVDPEAAVRVLRILMPAASLIPDSQSGRLTAYVGLSQHEVIKSVLKQMETDNPPEQQPKMEVYSLGEASSKQVFDALQLIAPKARLSLDPRTGKLVAWAGPADQKLLAETVAKLGGAGMTDGSRQVQTYRLTTADATAVLAVLRPLVPSAVLSYEPQSRSLIALALPTEQAVVKTTVEQLQREAPESERLKMVTYPLAKADPASVSRMLRTMFPNTQIVLDARARQVITWATPADHASVKAALAEMDTAAPGDSEESFMAYPVGSADPLTVTQLILARVPELRVAADRKANQVLVWGRKSDLAVVAEMAKQLQAGADAEFTLEVYTLALPESQPNAVAPAVGRKSRAAAATTKTATGSDALSILKMMFPNARFAAAAEAHRIIAWARPSDHVNIKKAVAELSKPESAQTAPRVEIYTVETAGATNLVPLLKNMFPEAQFTAGNEPNKLIALARPVDQDLVKSTLDQMSKKEPAETAFRLVVYTLQSVGAPAGAAAVPRKAGRAAATLAGKTTATGNLVPMLKLMFPNAQFAPGADPDKLLAWARPTDHAEIKKAIDELAKPEAPELAPKVVVYTVEGTPAMSAALILRTMFPAAQFTAGADAAKLIVLARPAEHEAIKAAVEQMSQKEAAATAYKLVVYALRSTAPAGAAPGAAGRAATAKTAGAVVILPILRQMFPTAQFSPRSRSRQAAGLGPAGRPRGDPEGDRRVGQTGSTGTGAKGGRIYRRRHPGRQCGTDPEDDVSRRAVHSRS